MCMWYCKREIETAQSTPFCYILSYNKQTKTFLECDVGMMIDRDVAEK